VRHLASPLVSDQREGPRRPGLFEEDGIRDRGIAVSDCFCHSSKSIRVSRESDIVYTRFYISLERRFPVRVQLNHFGFTLVARASCKLLTLSQRFTHRRNIFLSKFIVCIGGRVLLGMAKLPVYPFWHFPNGVHASVGARVE